MTAVFPYIDRLPAGYSLVVYRGRRYGLTKTVFNDGRSYKIYAEALGDTDFISLNFYLTGSGEQLRPCEMPAAKVIDFLRNLQPLPEL